MILQFMLVVLFNNNGNHFVVSPGFDNFETCNKVGQATEVWRTDYRYTQHVWHKCVQASSVEEAMHKAVYESTPKWIAHHDDSKGYFN